MSDTVVFGKKVSAALKAGLLYVFIDISLSVFQGVGQAMFELNQTEWDSWWLMKKIAWWMIQLGSVLASAGLLLKAYYSNSSKAPTQLPPAAP